jgi:hypothetical protein
MPKTYTLSIPFTFAATEPPANPPVPMWLQKCVVLDDEWEADDSYCAAIRRDLEAGAWQADDQAGA